jgi:hypothetical protein
VAGLAATAVALTVVANVLTAARLTVGLGVLVVVEIVGGVAIGRAAIAAHQGLVTPVRLPTSNWCAGLAVGALREGRYHPALEQGLDAALNPVCRLQVRVADPHGREDYCDGWVAGHGAGFLLPFQGARRPPWCPARPRLSRAARAPGRRRR